MAGLRGCVSYFTLPSAGAPAQKPSLMEGPPCYDSKHVLKTGRDSDNEILSPFDCCNLLECTSAR
jgi:hypothetical protein